jgi:hypothetical protein
LFPAVHVDFTRLRVIEKKSLFVDLTLMRDFLTRMGVNIIQITRMRVKTTRTAARKFCHSACLFNMKKTRN